MFNTDITKLERCVAERLNIKRDYKDRKRGADQKQKAFPAICAFALIKEVKRQIIHCRI